MYYGHQSVYTSPDGLCDDGRCKDEQNMKTLLRLREEEAAAVNTEKERVKSLLQMCQDIPEHVKGGWC